jgi:PKD repeat protein
VESAYTKPRALFVAQPASGDPPFTFYCTDMSLGGTSWSYVFGDGTAPNSSRSPWHTYNPGKYNCSLNINSATPEQDIYAAVITAGANSSGVMYMLLD